MDVRQAQEAAAKLLSPVPRRRAHALAVGCKAQALASQLPGLDERLLVAAAYLHDIGYAPALVDTGFHPLDGARWLADGGDSSLAGLVANHSAAHFEARERGLEKEIDAFPVESPEELEALTYCDLTTGPAGEEITLEARVRDIHQRYDAEHPVVRALWPALPELTACVSRITDQLTRNLIK